MICIIHVDKHVGCRICNGAYHLEGENKKVKSHRDSSLISIFFFLVTLSRRRFINISNESSGDVYARYKQEFLLLYTQHHLFIYIFHTQIHICIYLFIYNLIHTITKTVIYTTISLALMNSSYFKYLM